MYAGEQLLIDKKFNVLQINDLRIWQLKLMCEIAMLAQAYNKFLPIPLNLTHLVVVQNKPISISFSKEERRFEVDGSYDTRYEIIKKRIDKALIKGTDERLTQPGMLAIVYSQEEEKEEYVRYLEYLRNLSYIKYDIEDHVLQDLQGVHGLRALRVKFNFMRDSLDKSLNYDDARITGFQDYIDSVNSLNRFFQGLNLNIKLNTNLK